MTTREDGATFDGHPGLDRWSAYYAGELAEDEQDRLQDHLVGCRECTGLVLDLDAFVEPAAERRTLASEIEKAAVWWALKPHFKTRWWSMPAPAALAASLLVAALGLGLWAAGQRELAGLRHEIAELSRPQPNAPVYDLDPRAALRGETSAGPALELPAGLATFTLILSPRDIGDYPRYRVELVDAGGRPALSVPGLEPDPMGVFTLALSRRSLPEGEYRVRLLGLEGEAPELIEEYPLELRYR